MKHTFQFNNETAIVKTTKGLVQGYEYDGLKIFKGIPYAKAKRFHAPVETEAWDGVFDATNFGTVPMIEDPVRPDNEMLVPHRFWPMSEDCQNLNIWTPGLDGEKRPVMVWIHGGGFTNGSAIEQIVYDGDHAASIGNVVFVSVNHRLNILGFSDLSDFGPEYKNSANAGMEDLVMALRWIRDNIEAFGGDPDNITLYGQSGGGGKIATLMQMPAADGLYHKAVIISGLMTTTRAVQPDKTWIPHKAMEELGISTVEELEQVDYRSLVEAFVKAAGKQVMRVFPLKNDYFYGYPTTYPFRPETANVPLITGTVFAESTPFQYYPESTKGKTREEEVQKVVDMIGQEAADKVIPVFEKAYPGRPVSHLLWLETFRRGVVKKYTKERSKFGPNTWQYVFDYDFPINDGLVAWHCSDIPFFFHDCDLAPYTQGEGSNLLEDRMFESILQFMKTGNPATEALPWKPVTETESNTMMLDTKPEVRSNYDDELLPLLEEYVQPKVAEFLAGLKQKNARA